jgi:hypothetical protein
MTRIECADYIVVPPNADGASRLHADPWSPAKAGPYIPVKIAILVKIAPAP